MLVPLWNRLAGKAYALPIAVQSSQEASKIVLFERSSDGTVEARLKHVLFWNSTNHTCG
jgi:hypothetical protein